MVTPPTREELVERAKRCHERQGYETKLMLQRTHMIVLLNSIAAVAAAQNIPDFARWTLGLAVVALDVLWLVAGIEAFRLLKSLRREIRKIAKRDRSTLPYDENVRQRVVNIQLFRVPPTTLFGICVPVAMLLAWIVIGVWSVSA